MSDDYPYCIAKLVDSSTESTLKMVGKGMQWDAFEVNAHLIAAAPDMYAMLEELATCGAIPNGHYIELIKDILAKARGGNTGEHP